MLLSLAVLLLSASPLRAQDEEEVDEAPPPVQNQFAFADENFDQWIFNGRAQGDGRSWFESQLAVSLDEIDRACALTEAQKLKLRLAARGDVKRFYDLMEQKRKKFQALKNDQNKIQEIFQEIQPLQTALVGGPFRRGSLFAKTLQATLTPEQAAKLDVVYRDRAMFRYRARLELWVGSMDKAIGLTDAQRRKFVDVLARASSPSGRAGQYEYYLVMYRASQLPDDELRPIFDDAQWRIVRWQLSHAKGYESFLKQAGLLDEPGKGGKPEAMPDTP